VIVSFLLPNPLPLIQDREEFCFQSQCCKSGVAVLTQWAYFCRDRYKGEKDLSRLDSCFLLVRQCTI